jgi:hypothetical protein
MNSMLEFARRCCQCRSCQSHFRAPGGAEGRLVGQQVSYDGAQVRFVVVGRGRAKRLVG